MGVGTPRPRPTGGRTGQPAPAAQRDVWGERAHRQESRRAERNPDDIGPRCPAVGLQKTRGPGEAMRWIWTVDPLQASCPERRHWDSRPEATARISHWTPVLVPTHPWQTTLGTPDSRCQWHRGPWRRRRPRVLRCCGGPHGGLPPSPAWHGLQSLLQEVGSVGVRGRTRGSGTAW